jgi:hypothetical protein
VTSGLLATEESSEACDYGLLRRDIGIYFLVYWNKLSYSAEWLDNNEHAYWIESIWTEAAVA